ncbi:MAG: YtxH domain-containing protein [Gemmatimonadota bacterium]|nr:YtxH domain-containing protein [Gemmatimonadota bacterium]
MEHQNETRISFLSGLLLGAAIGASVALLTAPEPGRRTRRRIQKTAGEFRDTAGDRWEDLADDVKGRVDEAFKGARDKIGS